MDIHKRFPSIAHPEAYGYSYISDIWDSRSNFNMYMRMWRTEGDGMTQHSHDWAITQEFAGDYLHSLALAALDDEELCKGIGWRIPEAPKAERIAFAASVKWDAEKGYSAPRFFSLELLKIGSNRKLEHDRRYERIERQHDGGPRSIWGILRAGNDHMSGIESFILADAIKEYTDREHGYGTMEVTSKFLGWSTSEDHAAVELSQKIRNGLRTLGSVLEAYKLRDHARSYLECYRHNLDNEKIRAVQPLQLSA